MFLGVFAAEFRRSLRSVSFYLFTALLFFGAYIFASNLNPNTYLMGLSIGKEWHNAPLLIAKLTARFSVVGALFAVVMVGRVVTRDFAVRIHDFFFTVPMSKGAYLGGRFLGGFTANLLIYSGIAGGFIVGCLVIDPKYSGPLQLMAYLLPAVIILVPNLLFIGSIFFSLATLSRKMVMTYLAAVAFLMIYGLVQGGFAGWENDTAKILLDPFAISALDILTRYWTVAEINLNQIPLEAPLLWNRVIWTSISLGLLLYTWHRFRFVSVLEKKKGPLTDQTASASNGIHALGTIQPTMISDTLSLRTDLFETITIWDNEAQSASCMELDDGRYQVTLDVTAAKFRADSIGNQREIPIDDLIYVGVFGDDKKELYMQKHRLAQNEAHLEVIVNEKPSRAGIDPYLILIDRERDNNLVDISIE